jgi:IS5 family transposase
MVELRHEQRQLWEGFFAQEARQWEPWMEKIDPLLEDEDLLDLVHQALGKRHPLSRQRGRKQTPAEPVLRLLVLKHVRNWSYATLEREVRPNVVYRKFTRIEAGKVPDAKTLARQCQALGPEVVEQIHQRLVEIAQEKKVVRGRKLRVDTTVVETNIHYPTDSSLLGDGVRVLTRTMQKINALAGEGGTRLRNRLRSVGRKVMQIARTSRNKGKQVEEKLQQGYRHLLTATRKVVNQAKRFGEEIATGVKRARGQQRELQGLRQELETMIPRVQQVIRQTRARMFGGNVHAPDKLLSLFEPQTEVIRKGKASRPNEFGKMVKIQEAENQIITAYQVYAERPSDSDLLVESIQVHAQRLGRVPELVAADAGFYSAANERAAEAMGVKRVSIPSRSTKSVERRGKQKQRWFKKGQKWRTGCEGRISVLKRRHGLNRCRYRGEDGMHRWVGLGVIADTLINIGRVLAARDTG